MLYHLFEYLDKHMHFPGSGLFHYLSFRAALSILISLTISMVFGKTLIRMLRKKQVGETIRDLGLDGQMQKAGTPTMGGLIILAAILVPTLLLADLTNIYIQIHAKKSVMTHSKLVNETRARARAPRARLSARPLPLHTCCNPSSIVASCARMPRHP